MRPLRMEVKGFTAFREPVDVDFTQLDVFAISGDTGAGKSSLLDAMTYALYGKVDRVGARVGQLISQGLPRMAVTLEFEVGRDHYRVTRSTPLKGASKILLERQQAGEDAWTQAGDGADRVRDADGMIVRAIGLTYDGFTRSVLLPQGRFAEFLVGDPKKRRDILTELLGLSVFGRMAGRAGVVSREAAIRSQERSLSLEREYADATAEALAESRREAEDASRREAELGKAGARLLKILASWTEAKRSVDELRSCADDAAAAAADAERAAVELRGLAVELRDAERASVERTAAATDAERALEKARATLAEAEATSGSAKTLTAALAHAHALEEVTRSRATLDARLVSARAEEEPLASARADAERTVAAAAAALEEWRDGLDGAEAALERARRADLVAAVSVGLRPGDPCPVCGEPLEAVPSVADGAVAHVTEERDRARAAFDAARSTLAEAERALQTAGLGVEANAEAQARLREDLGASEEQAARHRTALTDVLGDPLPADPAGDIDGRLARLEAFATQERAAERAAAEAAKATLAAEHDVERLRGRIDRQRDRLEADRGPLLERAARAAGDGSPRPTLPGPDVHAAPDALIAFADTIAATLAALAADLARRVDAHAVTQGRLLRDANDAVHGLVPAAAGLDELATAVNQACREATARVATTAQRVTGLVERLERKKELQQEVKYLDDRHRLFRVLALELRADHLIAFLQAEALQVLAAAGSERLTALSGGRYQLACHDDEFVVVDTWNADEERSVRTLSGGETFLASLSLALALADQVRSLSTTDRARLDSLFLDEGFGTLDQDTLRVVVDAIEQLAGDGRLVGVITHVRDLAEQFPRLEVEKSQRGSSLRLVPA